MQKSTTVVAKDNVYKNDIKNLYKIQIDKKKIFCYHTIVFYDNGIFSSE